VAGGAIGERIELAFLDAVFHFAARAIERLVKRARLAPVLCKPRDDEARLAASRRIRRRRRAPHNALFQITAAFTEGSDSWSESASIIP
jgi:hypothetical protein